MTVDDLVDCLSNSYQGDNSNIQDFDLCHFRNVCAIFFPGVAVFEKIKYNYLIEVQTVNIT